MKILTHLCRFIIGVLFIFSGFVKLVDPLGSAYKFEEYFGADVLNLEFLIPYALPFSILLILIELLLGIALLLGYKVKTTVWSLFGITLFFLFLTWYSAYYNKVTDCGCFGDAVKLSPWETFYKNVVFIVLIFVLIVQQKNIKPLGSKNFRNWTLFLSMFASLYIIYHSLTYLPIIDFRPYAEGKNIREGMEYKEDGELPPVHDLYLESETEDLTETILEAPKALLIVANELEHTPPEAWQKVIGLATTAKEQGYLVYAVSSSSSALFDETMEKYNLSFPILFCDSTTLKTMCRANPGILQLNKATVIAKYSWRNIDKERL
ncbi:BT_3928 family protein [Ochrovirga pacifica]|uniref:BT_3928 family protein n=1 Tax=Ochrovirga pacifica TaxID=1042376 RepID=UPI0002557F9F|nr:BT_3928 family protein [Ochrovirga pacifica]